jgi:hypothetical protein
MAAANFWVSLLRGMFGSPYTSAPQKTETAAFAKKVGKPSAFHVGYFQIA